MRPPESAEEERGEVLYDVMGQMEELLSKPGIQAKEKLCFVPARAHDTLGNPQRVFEFLEPANRMVREKFDYDVASDIQCLKSIEKIFTSDLLCEKKGSGSDNSSPIFIAGMPRSGTTLVEQILASHSQVAAVEELCFLNAAVLESQHLAAPFRADVIRLPNYSQIQLATAP